MEENNDIFSVRLERDELHRWMGGGIPKSSIVLIEGGLGTGKSILSQRFSFGFLENNIRCALLSTEMPFRDFIRQMNSLDYDVSSYLLSGQLYYGCSFLTITDAKRQEDPLGAILSNPDLLERDVILLDSFDPLIYGSGRSPDAILHLLETLKRIGSSGKVVLITADPDRADAGLMDALRSVADLSIQLEARQMASALKRKMTIVRFLKPGSRFTNMIGFRVEPGIGFVIEISMVA